MKTKNKLSQVRGRQHISRVCAHEDGPKVEVCMDIIKSSLRMYKIPLIYLI